MLQRDGVAHRRAIDLLDARDDEADLAGAQVPRGTDLGMNRPSLSTVWLRPVDMTRNLSPSLSAPFMTRTSDTTPT